ncbi:MAG TPA: helix-turn-helix domain-containing protein [Candidatus Saccharimonadales bacterium]|nr:helix-turn-helix domain-containing protein [Candidatus Saccharimonadales bacterium]
MAYKKLQKPAPHSSADDLPVEVLDPLRSAQYYSLVMPQPAQKLAPFIDHYWIMRWELPAGESFTAEVIPSPYINLTFMREGPRITGVTTGKYTYDVVGKGVIVGAKFLPGGYYALSRQSAVEVTDAAIPAQSIFAAATSELNERILTASTDAEAIRMMEEILLAQLPEPDKYIALVQTIITDIKQNDHPTVASVAQKFSISERRLQELFQLYVGVSPKWVLLRYRLLKATQMAMRPTEQSWTDIGIELGYSDQAHFINDFKRIIGQTPRQYSQKAHTQS